MSKYTDWIEAEVVESRRVMTTHSQRFELFENDFYLRALGVPIGPWAACDPSPAKTVL